MWFCALSELRISRTDPASPKESAAVVSSPVARAVCIRDLARSLRKVTKSYAASAVHAIKRATPQLIRMTRVSFCPMDRPWGIRISALAISPESCATARHSRCGHHLWRRNYPPVGTIGRETGCFDRIGGEVLRQTRSKRGAIRFGLRPDKSASYAGLRER